MEPSIEVNSDFMRSYLMKSECTLRYINVISGTRMALDVPVSRIAVPDVPLCNVFSTSVTTKDYQAVILVVTTFICV